MKLVPLGDRVVLKQMEAEEKTKSGIILTSSAQEKPQEAVVVAVGPGTDEVKMEVKVKDAMPLWLVPALSNNRIYPGSFSKYGSCYERFIAREAFKTSVFMQVREVKEAETVKGTEKRCDRHSAGCRYENSQFSILNFQFKRAGGKRNG